MNLKRNHYVHHIIMLVDMQLNSESLEPLPREPNEIKSDVSYASVDKSSLAPKCHATEAISPTQLDDGKFIAIRNARTPHIMFAAAAVSADLEVAN